MARKKRSGSNKPARKKKGDLKDLSSPDQELTEGQAKAVKGGTTVRKAGKSQQAFLKYTFEDTILSS
jgi:hypothetical protein